MQDVTIGAPLAGALLSRQHPTLWLDVEDLFDFVRDNARMTGIQRVSLEICAALVELFEGTGTVRFVRHGSSGHDLYEVPWDAVRALVESLNDRTPRSPPDPGPTPRRSGRWVASCLAALPPALREPLGVALGHQKQALHAYWLALRASVLLAGRALGGPKGAEAAEEPKQPVLAGETAPTRPGDVLVALGGAWCHPSYGTLVRHAREALGLRFALLVHDLIPIRRPEFCDPGFIRNFTAWLDATIGQADILFANSRATAADLEWYAARCRIALAGPLTVVPYGTGFGTAPAPADAGEGRLPAAGTYALFVSTIEGRKNHLLLFRVWRRLLEELPREQVPVLVFAGKVGWLVTDLMQQIANTDHLGGKILVLSDLTDGELARLYKGCVFSVFPSFYEGWGLPVTESLAFGKPCFAANAASLPEAGGRLARYFDPENVADALQGIRAVLLDRESLRRWEAEIAREFQPVPWSRAAKVLAATIETAELGAPR